MSELLDTYDCDHNFLKSINRIEAHKNAMWHDVFQCLILNNDKIVFQLRSKNKDSNAELLDISSGGHISSGEKISDGVREIEEELGLKVKFSDLKYIGYYQEAANNEKAKYTPFQSRHFCHSFLLKNNTPITDYKLQQEELDGIFEIKIQDCLELFSGVIKSIEISGFIISSTGLRTEKREITINDFTKKNNWLTFFIMAERFFENKKYLHI